MAIGDANGAEWRAYWSGRAQMNGGGSSIGASVERDAELADFWEQNLLERPVESRCLDLACGAGTVVRHAVGIGFYEVFGLDISPDAIALMEEANPAAKGLVGSAHTIPLPDASVDVVTSQFGFEYAGVEETMQEVARVLSPGGKFLAIVHMSEGDIAEECAKARQEAIAFRETGFVAAAREVFVQADALAETPEARPAYEAAVAAMRPAQMALSELAQAGHQMAQHTLAGTGQMFQRRQNYALQDITDWLDTLTRENEAHYQRMHGMLQAAISRGEAERALTILRHKGLQAYTLRALTLGPTEDKVGWILEADKPS